MPSVSYAPPPVKKEPVASGKRRIDSSDDDGDDADGGFVDPIVAAIRKAGPPVAKRARMDEQPASAAPRAPPTPARAGEAPAGMLWADYYAPKTSADLVGNKGPREALLRWLKAYETPGRLPKGPGSAPELKKYRAKHQCKCPKVGQKRKSTETCCAKAWLFMGDPGLGKTSMTTLVAAEAGYRVVEFNASDVRSAKILKQKLKELVKTKRTLAFGAKSGGDVGLSRERLCLIMDECDGMSAGDRGGLAEVNKFIQEARVPIILIGNDEKNNWQKMKTLTQSQWVHYANFTKPRASEVLKRVQLIARKQNISMNATALTELIESSKCDLRCTINRLQMLSYGGSSFSFDDVKASSQTGQKDREYKTLFDLNIFSASDLHGKSLNQRLDKFFFNADMTPLFAQNNYVKHKPLRARGNELTEMQLLADAASSIALGDQLSSKIMGATRANHLYPIMGMVAVVLPGSLMAGGMADVRDRDAFPSLLGNMSKGRKFRAVATGIAHNMHSATGSVDGTEVVTDYAAGLAPHLFGPLAAPVSAKAADEVEQVIAFMDEYHLCVVCPTLVVLACCY